ncbi:MAG TPA: Gfo/Idh/MocA family oxidoreductase, partial [Xanthobacteraceae bacterium]
MTDRKLRLGIAGLGRAFSLMIPTLTAHPLIEIAAGADPRPEARMKFAGEFHAGVHATVEELCADRNVEAVYISTPHQFHAAHVALAAAAGKHVLVEKPMALSLAECRQMIAATRAAGVTLVVGHSHSFDAPIARTRELVATKTYGDIRMITALNFTDFLYRPRRPEELDTSRGGGVLFNQAPHQVDVVRLIGGGRVRSVRVLTGSFDPARPTEGAYSALLGFENGMGASLTYSGYAHFDSDELAGWIAESGAQKESARYGAARRSLTAVTGAEHELAIKTARNYGGEGYSPPAAGRFHQHFGFLIASCERADLRPLPQGVMIYGDTDQRLDPLPQPPVPRAEVIDELYDAIVHGRTPLHGGEWSLATMEVCL